MNTLYYLSKNLSFQMICLFAINLLFSRDNILLRHLTSFIKVNRYFVNHKASATKTTHDFFSKSVEKPLCCLINWIFISLRHLLQHFCVLFSCLPQLAVGDHCAATQLLHLFFFSVQVIQAKTGRETHTTPTPTIPNGRPCPPLPLQNTRRPCPRRRPATTSTRSRALARRSRATMSGAPTETSTRRSIMAEFWRLPPQRPCTRCFRLRRRERRTWRRRQAGISADRR